MLHDQCTFITKGQNVSSPLSSIRSYTDNWQKENLWTGGGWSWVLILSERLNLDQDHFCEDLL